MQVPLRRAAASLPTLAHAVLPAVPVVNRLPGIRRTSRTLPDRVWRRRAVVDRAHVAAYADVCGFEHRDVAPITYPHVLAFPLHLQILTDPSFPYAAVGTLHVANSVISRRPVRIGETLTFAASVGNLRVHPRGRTFEVSVTASGVGGAVWESLSTYLRTGVGGPDDGAAPALPRPAEPELPGDPDPAPGTWRGIPWQVPADQGRRYAAVSGDRNPIHLHPLTARAFGLRRPVAHGMWSAARCLAALDNRLPEAAAVEVRFRRPVPLPCTVVFRAGPAADGFAFALADLATGRDALQGSVRPAG